MKFLFSLEAVGSILVECYKGNSRLETGGVLVGPVKHKNIVTDIIPSTVYAERQVATYCQSKRDVQLLNKKLKNFQARGYDFKGYFHKHPSGLYQLSHGDIATCSEILHSTNYKINNHLIMCIVTESNHQEFPLFSYAVRLDSNGSVLVGQAKTSILPKACIEECAECFEPLSVGGGHEDNGRRQNSKPVEQRENPLWRGRKGSSNNKLP